MYQLNDVGQWTGTILSSITPPGVMSAAHFYSRSQICVVTYGVHPVHLTAQYSACGFIVPSEPRLLSYFLL